ncbi:MAG TPA: winged helix-turn-helix domain-containing protein [Gryllotalpicola sp.]
MTLTALNTTSAPTHHPETTHRSIATRYPAAPRPVALRPVAPARPTAPARPVVLHPVPAAAPATAPASQSAPSGTPRGFALYVGLDESKAAAAGTDLGHVVAALKRLLADIAPGAESFASVALAPEGAGGRDVDVVRLALRDPSAVAKNRPLPPTVDDPADRTGVVIDVTRRHLLLDGERVSLTFKEFELLQYLVLREGRTIERTELVSSLWSHAEGEEVPGERTIDVHVRRLRSKLGRYEDIVRTVRGIGYRFDRHADVVIRYGHGTPSPDRF